MNAPQDKGEFDRWFRSAEAAYSFAERDLEKGDYKLACIRAHQASEKALKALLWGSGNPAYGHSLKKLYGRVSKILGEDEKVMEDSARLDEYHLLAKKHEVWERGILEEPLTKKEAEEALQRAKRILEWVKKRCGGAETRDKKD